MEMANAMPVNSIADRIISFPVLSIVAVSLGCCFVHTLFCNADAAFLLPKDHPKLTRYFSTLKSPK